MIKNLFAQFKPDIPHERRCRFFEQEKELPEERASNSHSNKEIAPVINA